MAVRGTRTYDRSVRALPKYVLNLGFWTILDYLWAEWDRKPAAFVSFGNVGGARAIEQLRGIAVELCMAPLRDAVHIFGAGDKLATGHFAADSRDESQLTRLFDSLA